MYATHVSGALARNGWLPRGFVAARSGRTGDYEKRHIGSLARLGWLPNAHGKDTNRYYRGGRDFGLPGVPPPKSYLLRASPQLGHCQCKRGPIIPRFVRELAYLTMMMMMVVIIGVNYLSRISIIIKFERKN